MYHEKNTHWELPNSCASPNKPDWQNLGVKSFYMYIAKLNDCLIMYICRLICHRSLVGTLLIYWCMVVSRHLDEICIEIIILKSVYYKL